MAIGLPEATLLATILGGIVFGFYSVIVAITVYLTWRSKSRVDRQSHLALKTVFVTMYLFSFIFLIISIIRTVTGFIYRPDPVAYFGETQTSLYILRSTLLVFQTLIGDSFLIYRVNIVWNNNLWLLIPTCLLGIGDALTGSGALHTVATASMTQSIFQVRNWIVAFFATTFVTNGLCTILIALKLWLVHRQTTHKISPPDTTTHVLNLLSLAEIILESGALYSIMLASQLATLLCSNWSQYIILDMLPHITGIVFSIIIVRLHLAFHSFANCADALSHSIRSIVWNNHPSNNLTATSVQFATGPAVTFTHAGGPLIGGGLPSPVFAPPSPVLLTPPPPPSPTKPPTLRNSRVSADEVRTTKRKKYLPSVRVGSLDLSLEMQHFRFDPTPPESQQPSPSGIPFIGTGDRSKGPLHRRSPSVRRLRLDVQGLRLAVSPRPSPTRDIPV